MRWHAMDLKLSLSLIATLGALGCGTDSKSSRRNAGANQAGEPQPVDTSSSEPSWSNPSSSILPPAGSQTILPPKLYPLRVSDSQIALIPTEEENFSIRWQLLDQAQRSVKIQSLLFSGDESGWVVADKLIELHKKGIKVEVITDAISNYSPWDHVLFYHLNSNGVIVHGYEAVFLKAFKDIAALRPRDEFFDANNKRAHEKIIIVDSEIPEKAVAIIGGSNVQNGYYRFSDLPKFLFRDQDVVLRGGVVTDILASFNENLARGKAEWSVNQVLDTGSFWKTLDLLRSSIGLDLSINAPRPKMSSTILQRIEAAKTLTSNLKWVTVPMRYFQSQPTFRSSEIFALYAENIKNAKRSIVISNAYFIPTAELRVPLQAAAKRGVKVKILTNSPESSDLSQAQFAARSQYPQLFDFPEHANIELYEWGGYKIFNNLESLHHAKYAVFDEDISVVGSYNLDPRSQYLNSEVAIVAQSAEIASDLLKRFQNDTKVGVNVNRIDKTSIASIQQNYTFLENLKEYFAQILVPFL